MENAFNFVPRVAIFLAGVAAGALTLPRREGGGGGLDPAIAEEFKKQLTQLQDRLATQNTTNDTRFTQIEKRLDEHSAKLAEVPSTEQIVHAMEQLLSKAMSSLDERLTTQAHSIDVLKTTVSQTDSLLERVLESLDSLQTYTDPSAFSDDALLHPTV
jgi:hypothetical protein